MEYPKRLGKFPARALARMLNGQELTHISFQRETASYRLSAAIERLRNHFGWPVLSKERTGKTRDPIGRNAAYFVYYLSPNLIADAGEQGIEYMQKVFQWEEMRKEGEAATSQSYSKTTLTSRKANLNVNTSMSGCN